MSSWRENLTIKSSGSWRRTVAAPSPKPNRSAINLRPATPVAWFHRLRRSAELLFRRLQLERRRALGGRNRLSWRRWRATGLVVRSIEKPNGGDPSGEPWRQISRILGGQPGS
jgi:hypothetical protein